MNRIQYDRQVHNQVMQAAFPDFYAAKNDIDHGVTFTDLAKWAEKHSLSNGRLLYEGGPAIRFKDWQGMTKTYTFATLIRLIQEG